MITDKVGGSSAKPEVWKQSKEKQLKHKVSGYKSQSKRWSIAGCRLLLRTLIVPCERTAQKLPDLNGQTTVARCGIQFVRIAGCQHPKGILYYKEDILLPRKSVFFDELYRHNILLLTDFCLQTCQPHQLQPLRRSLISKLAWRNHFLTSLTQENWNPCQLIKRSADQLLLKQSWKVVEWMSNLQRSPQGNKIRDSHMLSFSYGSNIDKSISLQ